MTSPARRTNIALGTIAIVIVVISVIVGLIGTPDGAVAPSITTTTTADDNSDNKPPTTPDIMSRPADTSRSWFSHSFEVEQFDFPMESLDCDELAQFLTVELCTVARTEHGDFMVTAAEAFWDPENPDDDGVVRIEMNFTVYSHSVDFGPARAVSVLDGRLSSRYDSEPTSIELFTTEVAGNDVVVVQRVIENAASTALGQDTTSIQVLAMEPSGLPSVVATYDGIGTSFASTDSELIVTSLRFGPPSGDVEAEPWLTVLQLSPTSDGTWREVFSSQPESQNPLAVGTKPQLAGSYDFPRSNASRIETN